MHHNQLQNTLSELFVTALGLYLLLGFLFAIPFVLVGVSRIDPHTQHAPWGFRFLILPGATFLWPILLRRWALKLPPPSEKAAHRL